MDSTVAQIEGPRTQLLLKLRVQELSCSSILRFKNFAVAQKGLKILPELKLKVQDLAVAQIKDPKT